MPIIYCFIGNEGCMSSSTNKLEGRSLGHEIWLGYMAVSAERGQLTST